MKGSSSLLPLMLVGFSSTLVVTATRSSGRYFGTAAASGRIAAFSTLPTISRRSPTVSRLFSTTAKESVEEKRDNFDENKNDNDNNDDNDDQYSPWNHPGLAERAKNNKQAFRSRQHVNPLAKKFQQPTILSEQWPKDVFEDLSKPYFLDIGCSRGGFLIDMATKHPNDYNYLGLEIRPIVVYHAKERVGIHNLQGTLDFVGCNANVDLERLLYLLKGGENQNRGSVEMVTIQFPDPHFKARHAKRRVVTPQLVTTLAKYMPTGATVFLQSDVQSVLDEMRLQFRELSQYFQDVEESVEAYLPENILGVPTEREISVLERDLPVFRAKFERTSVAVSKE